MIRTLAWWGMNQRISRTWQSAWARTARAGVGQDPHRPLEHGSAVHRQVMKALLERPRSMGESDSHRPAGSAGRRPSHRSRAGRRPVPGRDSPGASRTAPAPSPNSGKLFWSPGLITRLLQSPPIDQARNGCCPVATNCAAMTRAKTKPGARRLDVESGTVQLEPVLNQVGGRWERHVRE